MASPPTACYLSRGHSNAAPLAHTQVLRVLWFFTLTLSFVLFLVGVTTTSVISRERLSLLNVTLSSDTFSAFTVVGTALVLLCLLVQAAVKWWQLKGEDTFS
jgi:hypothetical protein